MTRETEAEAWARVGEAVRRRRAEQGLSQKTAAATAGISDNLWRQIEKGRGGGAHHDTTPAGICRALKWMPDSIDRILEGKEPEPTGSGDPIDERLAALERWKAELEERQQQSGSR